jgi:hypothetical protein
LVAYDTATGNALWARTTTANTTGTSRFMSVAVDGSGNIMVAGYQTGTSAYNYGSGTVTSTYAGGNNALVVQYNSSGSTIWAKTVTTGSNISQFNGIAVDSASNIYAAGEQYGTTSYNYGVSATGTSTTYNAVLVKYSFGGTALWAKSTTAGTADSLFYAVTVDTSGNNIYAAGGQIGTGSYNYGGGTVIGTSTLSNAMIVKYNNAGTASLAKTVTSGSSDSVFYFVAVAPTGEPYAAGAQNGTGSYNYGSGPVTGPASGAGAIGQNAVIVKYDTSLNTLWAKGIVSGPAAATLFNSLAIDSAGNIFAPGLQTGTSMFTYGPASVAGTYATTFNALLVKYR